MEKTIEFNRFFQNDWGKTTSQQALQGIEQILPPKQTPLPCLLFQSFFYGQHAPYQGNTYNDKNGVRMVKDYEDTFGQIVFAQGWE